MVAKYHTDTATVALVWRSNVEGNVVNAKGCIHFTMALKPELSHHNPGVTKGSLGCSVQ